MTLITLFSTFNVTSSAAGDELLPYAYKTDTVSQTLTKAIYTSQFGNYNGTVSFSYTVSGNYVYNASSGEITSAYGTSIVNYYINYTPGGADWDLRLDNITYYTPVVGGNGSYADFPFSFTVSARPCPGGFPAYEYQNIGSVSSSIRVYAQ